MKITKKKVVKESKKLIKKLRDPTSALQTAALTAIASLMYIVRAFPYFKTPQLYAEDGTVWLSEGFNNGYLVLQPEPYNGFFHYSERVFGYVVAQLPLHWAPALFAYTSLGLFAVMVYYLLSTRTEILKNNFERIFMVIALGLIANFGEFYFNFSNSIFLIGIIGALILVAKPAKNRVGNVAEKVTFIAAGLTLPFSWIYLPIALFDKVKNKAKNDFFVITSAATAVAQLIGYYSVETDRSPVTLASLLSKWVVLTIHNQIIIPAIRFARIDTSIEEYGHLYPMLLTYIILAAFIIATIVVLKKSNWQVRFLLFFLAGMTFASIKSPTIRLETATEVFQHMAVMGGGHRYFVYGIVAANIILAKAAYEALVPKARYVFITLFFALALISSAHYGELKVDKDWKDFSQAYNQAIDEYNRTGESVIVPINPEPWTMGIFKKD